jgi:arabinan endo-1,5-alpha-L-arabinosidase
MLAATAEAELAVVPAFTGAPDQLWRIEQLADGSYRLMPKANGQQSLALSAIGSSMPTLETYRADSDRQRWLLRAQ